MTLNEAVAAKIKILLKEKNWTPYRLFKESGVYQSTISDILNVRCQRIDVNHLHGFARAFGVSLAEFFSDPTFENILDE